MLRPRRSGLITAITFHAKCGPSLLSGCWTPGLPRAKDQCPSVRVKGPFAAAQRQKRKLGGELAKLQWPSAWGQRPPEIVANQQLGRETAIFLEPICTNYN